MFFTKGGLCSLPRGRSYVQLEKKLQLEKIKTKKGSMYNSKSKN